VLLQQLDHFITGYATHQHLQSTQSHHTARCQARLTWPDLAWPDLAAAGLPPSLSADPSVLLGQRQRQEGINSSASQALLLADSTFRLSTCAKARVVWPSSHTQQRPLCQQCSAVLSSVSAVCQQCVSSAQH
jgi:hypothetical protein